MAKLGDDVLVAIMTTFRKGLVENCDISELLRQLDLVPGDYDGKLKLNPLVDDVWKDEPKDH